MIDPAIDRALATLRKKCSTVAASYRDARVFKSLEDFIKDMDPADRPQAVIIGSPPMFRGTARAGRDIEMQILKLLPGVPMFVEKPVAIVPITEIDEIHKVAKYISDSEVVCSVGYVYFQSSRLEKTLTSCSRYMLRYLKAVQMMKKLIQANNLTVVCTIARYASAYESIPKPDWWDKFKRCLQTISFFFHLLKVYLLQRWPDRRTGYPFL